MDSNARVKSLLNGVGFIHMYLHYYMGLDAWGCVATFISLKLIANYKINMQRTDLVQSYVLCICIFM